CPSRTTACTYSSSLSLHDALPICALVGTFSAVALGYRKSDIAIGLYGYNAALLGLLFVLLLGLSALTLGLIALGSVVTNLLQVRDRKSTRLNSSHVKISYAVLCLK